MFSKYLDNFSINVENVEQRLLRTVTVYEENQWVTAGLGLWNINILLILAGGYKIE